MVYNYQVENVRNFVANHPSHTLLEVDITMNETGKILADAFGLKEDCWGHYNKNQGGGGDSRAAKRKGHLDAMKAQAKKYKQMHEESLISY